MNASIISAKLSTHGMSKSRTYGIWVGVLTRCYNRRSKSYERYGGRGILVCDRWKDSFENFLKDMGEAVDGYTIERIENNGNYEPGNCRWIPGVEQSYNRRNTLRVFHKGTEMPLKHACEQIGVSYQSTRNMMIRRAVTPQQIFDERLLTAPSDD